MTQKYERMIQKWYRNKRRSRISRATHAYKVADKELHNVVQEISDLALREQFSKALLSAKREIEKDWLLRVSGSFIPDDISASRREKWQLLANVLDTLTTEYKTEDKFPDWGMACVNIFMKDPPSPPEMARNVLHVARRMLAAVTISDPLSDLDSE